MACKHPDLQVECDFNRLTDSEGGAVTGYLLDVRARCAACGMPFCFRGLPLGLSHLAPTGSLDALTASLPLYPEDDPTTGIGLPGFSVGVLYPEDEPAGPGYPGVDTSNPDDHGMLP